MHGYKRVSPKRSLPISIRIVTFLSSIMRFLSIATWVVGLVFLLKYAFKYINRTKEEKRTIYCDDCMFSYAVSIVASCLVWVLDPLFLSNAVGAYLRNQYGAGINSTPDDNLEAVCDLSDESPSLSARCLGCGCYRGLGIVYQKGVCGAGVRAEGSKSGACGNYMCFAVAPFAWTRGAVKCLGYGGAVALSFVVTLLFFAGAVGSTAYGVVCVVNDVNCLVI